MSAIHFTLMGKGGVGKSFASWILAQYLTQREGANVFCADTDPTNPTFSSYPAFQAKHINIMKPDMNIDKSHLDDLIDMLLEHDGDCVVDNGASSFLPIMAYMTSNQVIEYLQQAGKKVFIHAPLIGGLGMDETLRGLDTILKSLPAPVAAWIYELYGPVEKHGKPVHESNLYFNNKDRFVGMVKIQQREEDTWLKDLHIATSRHLTLDEASTDPGFKTMQKQRFIVVKTALFQQLEQIAW